MQHYEIEVQGVLDDHWAGWFEDLDVSNRSGTATVISGRLPDQAALHGVLTKIRDLGLVIIEVRRLDPPPPPGHRGAADR